MRILVAGSRRKWWRDPDHVAEFVDGLMDGVNIGGDDVLVNGMEPTGVDLWAREAAERRGIRVDPHPAEWQLFGKAAAHIRNEDMAKIADDVWLVWDGRSPGTKDMLDLAVKWRRPITIVFPEADVPCYTESATRQLQMTGGNDS